MSSGGGGGSETTRIEPPGYQLPYLQSGLGRAESLYQGGSPVVPFSQPTQAALAGTAARATAGSPVNTAASNYTQNVLSGGMLGANPYLQATFNKAADATQNRLASEFARSGRNVGASEGLRAQQLNDLATSIYGGNYQFERGLQQSTLPLAAQVANQDYVDLNALRGVGGELEGQAQRMADAPGRGLDQYLGRVRGTDFGSTQTSPLHSNRAGNALGGALLGSALYGANPLLGAIGGGLLGGIFR